MPTFKVNNAKLVGELEATVPRVLCVEATARTSPRDVVRCAKSVSEQTRRLHLQGYDLVSCTCKAWLLRSDDFSEK